MRPPREDTSPWYRQFWPWFLISIPALTIIGALVTINLAIETDDGLVKDDYYKEGLAIRKDAARVHTAQQLGISALLQHDPRQGGISLQLNDAAVGDLHQLILTLFHPTRSNQDQTITLTRTGEGLFEGKLAPLEQANWQLAVEPTNSQWRISGRLSVPGEGRAQLQ